MKYVIALSILLCGWQIVFAADTGFFSVLQEKTLITDTGEGTQIRPIVSAYILYRFSYGIGWETLLSLHTKYAQSYTGLNYKPFSWLALSADFGIEQAQEGKSWMRFAQSLMLGFGSVSLFTVFEESESAWFYVHETNIKVSDHAGLGLMSQRGVGTGPRMEFVVSQKPTFKIFASGPLYDLENSHWNYLIGGVRVIY